MDYNERKNNFNMYLKLKYKNIFKGIIKIEYKE